jgi:hypothetical protein
MGENTHDEARRLVEVFAGRPDQLVTFLSAQLTVVKTHAQMLMGLSGLVVTVTGFSGHNMVRGGAASTAAMSLGILAVLVAVVLTLRVSSRLRWVSEDLADDLVATAAAVIRRRDQQTRALGYAGALVTLGLSSYLVSVVLAALAVGAQMGPPPS